MTLLLLSRRGKFATGTAVIAAVLLGAAARYEFGGSPAAIAAVTLAGQSIEIRYASPSVRGRQIFGAAGTLSADPTFPVWRAGANWATTLRTAGDLDIGGLVVPAGTYTLYVLVSDPDAWQLIVNRQTGQWGRSYDAAHDLGRVRMTMSKPPALVERLTYALTDHGGGRGELRLAWEHRVATVPLTLQRQAAHPSSRRPGRQPLPDPAPCFHSRSCTFAERNLSMMADVCSQLRASAANCLRPRRVRPFLLQLEQHRVERPLIDGQQISADLLDSAGDSKTVHRFQTERL